MGAMLPDFASVARALLTTRYGEALSKSQQSAELALYAYSACFKRRYTSKARQQDTTISHFIQKAAQQHRCRCCCRPTNGKIRSSTMTRCWFLCATCKVTSPYFGVITKQQVLALLITYAEDVRPTTAAGTRRRWKLLNRKTAPHVAIGQQDEIHM